MLCGLDFEPLSLSLSSMPSCDLVSLTNMLILLHYLESFKSELAEEKGVDIQELGEFYNNNNFTIIFQPTITNKGKGILIEPVKPIKKKDLISFDEEAALKLQAEFDEEERLAEDCKHKNKRVVYKRKGYINFNNFLEKNKKSICQLKRKIEKKKQTTNKSSTEKDNVYLPKEHGRIQAQRFEVERIDYVQRDSLQSIQKGNKFEDFRTEFG
ncbi:hypothetical protein Tco_0700065 [Tanacetum coccineum]